MSSISTCSPLLYFSHQSRLMGKSIWAGSVIPMSARHLTSTRNDRVAAVSMRESSEFRTLFKTSISALTSRVQWCRDSFRSKRAALPTKKHLFIGASGKKYKHLWLVESRKTRSKICSKDDINDPKIVRFYIQWALQTRNSSLKFFQPPLYLKTKLSEFFKLHSHCLINLIHQSLQYYSESKTTSNKLDHL